VVFTITLIFMRETNPFVLLERKAKKLRKETGNQNLRSALDTGRTPRDLFKSSIFRPLKMLFCSPIVFMLSTYMAIVYGILYLLLTTFFRVFQGQYGFSTGSVGLVFLGFGAGAAIALVVSGVISDRMLKTLTARNGGSPKPEYRLPMLFAGAVLIPVSLFMYGWTAEKKVHWIVPIIATAILGMGQFSILMPIQTYIVDAFTVHAASATAAGTVSRSLLGALLPLAGNPMYDALGIGWGTSLLAFIAVLFVPMPYVFWKYGERIRNSRFSQVQF
jgi:MFS family permease